MKQILALVILSALTAYGQAIFRSPSYIASFTSSGTVGGGGGGAVCQTNAGWDQSLRNDYQPVGQNDTSYYVGQLWPNTEPETIVCKIGVMLATVTGDPSSKTFTCAIYTLSGVNLGSVITNGTAGTITGVTGGWAWYNFEFSTPPTLAASTAYAIVITMNEADGSNNAGLGYQSTDVSAGKVQTWSSDKVQSADRTTWDLTMKIYYKE